MPDLVLARLRQLNQDGSYDWLASMARQTKAPWERRFDGQIEQGAWGVGALSDDQLVGLAVTTVFSTVPLHADLQRRIAQELQSRGLANLKMRQVCDAATETLALVWTERMPIDMRHPRWAICSTPAPWPAPDKTPGAAAI